MARGGVLGVVPPGNSALVAGQPGLLVLDQLEQRGLDLLDLRDLGEHELAVLTGGLDHQPAEPSIRSIRPCENDTSLIRISGKSRPDRARIPSRSRRRRVVSS